ncbi:hypothetical protein BDV39DRAFT_166177 [Aspergillus sergii]|uniref:Uncharacterized protein n=1 Tax=Aspergillus sergii TaxID=1034303 RepID=A0A5N6XIF1_9EURO|nr:hypothetical protein BDV39DRAFT_166177 [Aspergillus sergii]
MGIDWLGPPRFFDLLALNGNRSSALLISSPLSLLQTTLLEFICQMLRSLEMIVCMITGLWSLCLPLFNPYN